MWLDQIIDNPDYSKSFSMSITGCNRCHGGGHKDLEFKLLTYPLELPDHKMTHWALCPINDEPILFEAVYEDD